MPSDLQYGLKCCSKRTSLRPPLHAVASLSILLLFYPENSSASPDGWMSLKSNTTTQWCLGRFEVHVGVHSALDIKLRVNVLEALAPFTLANVSYDSMSERDQEFGAMCERLLKLAAKSQQKAEATGLELVTCVRRNRNHEVMRWVRSCLGGPAFWRGEGCDKLVEIWSLDRELDHLWTTDEVTKHILTHNFAAKTSGVEQRFRVERDCVISGDEDGRTRQLDEDKVRSVHISESVVTRTVENGQTHHTKGEPEQLHQWQQPPPSAEAVLLEKVFEDKSSHTEPMRASRSQTLSTEHEDDSSDLAARVKEARKALDQSRAELDATLDARHMRRPLSPVSPDVSAVPTKSTLETRAILASISRIERKLDDPPRVSLHDANSKLVTIVATAAARAAVSVWREQMRQCQLTVQHQQKIGQQPLARHIPHEQATGGEQQPISGAPQTQEHVVLQPKQAVQQRMRSAQQSMEDTVLRPQPAVQQPMRSAQQSDKHAVVRPQRWEQLPVKGSQQSTEHATVQPQQAAQQSPWSAQQCNEPADVWPQQAVHQPPRSAQQSEKSPAMVQPPPPDKVPPPSQFSQPGTMRPSEGPEQHSIRQKIMAHDMMQPEQLLPATHFPKRETKRYPARQYSPPASHAVTVPRRARLEAISQSDSSSLENRTKKANKIRKKSLLAWKVYAHPPAAASAWYADSQPEDDCSTHLIDLSGQCLRDRDLQVVCASLAEVRCINVSKNALTDVGVAVLCRTLSKTGSDVDLSRNAIGPAGALTLARAVAVGRLRSLDCSENPIGDKGAASLIGTVATDPPLVSLSLDCSETSVKLLVEALHTNSTLERLSLCGLDFNKRRPELARAAQLHAKLRTLLIDGVPCGQASVSTRKSGATTNRLERLCRTFDRIEEEVASLRTPLDELCEATAKSDIDQKSG